MIGIGKGKTSICLNLIPNVLVCIDFLHKTTHLKILFFLACCVPYRQRESGVGCGCYFVCGCPGFYNLPSSTAVNTGCFMQKLVMSAGLGKQSTMGSNGLSCCRDSMAFRQTSIKDLLVFSSKLTIHVPCLKLFLAIPKLVVAACSVDTVQSLLSFGHRLGVVMSAVGVYVPVLCRALLYTCSIRPDSLVVSGFRISN